jgi:hypothetical protein
MLSHCFSLLGFVPKEQWIRNLTPLCFRPTPLCFVLSFSHALLYLLLPYHTASLLTTHHITRCSYFHSACNPSPLRCYVFPTIHRLSRPECRRRQSRPIRFQLPLPWLIPLFIFSPFFFGLIVFVVYRYTVVRHRRAKQAALGGMPNHPNWVLRLKLEFRPFLQSLRKYRSLKYTLHSRSTSSEEIGTLLTVNTEVEKSLPGHALSGLNLICNE